MFTLSSSPPILYLPYSLLPYHSRLLFPFLQAPTSPTERMALDSMLAKHGDFQFDQESEAIKVQPLPWEEHGQGQEHEQEHEHGQGQG